MSSNSKSQRQRVVESILDQILSGDLEPGSPLRQVQLSKEYSVAQTVIREALQTLEQYGLVLIKENVGTFVKKMGPEELYEAYQVREVMEGLAARLCCRTVSRLDIDWLKAMAEKIRQSSNESKKVKSELEYKFHQRFLEISKNETLLRQSLGYRFVGNLIVTDRDKDEIFEEHMAIVTAIEENDPEKAESMARKHVSNSAKSILELLKEDELV